jgi:putative N6-adenine-specific DNA methylase
MSSTPSSPPRPESAWRVFFACAPGLEPALRNELVRLFPPLAGTLDRVPRKGGIEVRLTTSQATRAFLHVRCADGIRVRVGERRTPGFRELDAFLQRIPWHAWLQERATVKVYVTCRKSRLMHTDAIADRVAQAMHDARGATHVKTRGEGHLAVHVRLEDDVCTVSMDALLGLAHKRGYRTRVGTAPLRESLAACVVELLPVWPPAGLWDPCCGSGTLLLEAALRARGGPVRSEADGAWPVWPAWPRQSAAAEPAVGTSGPRLFGSDLRASEVENARANFRDAGWERSVERLEVADLRAGGLDVPEGTWIVSNLPYGRRSLDPAQLDPLYHAVERSFGRSRGRIEGALVVTRRDGALARRAGWTRVVDFDNRGVGVSLYQLAPPPSGRRAPRARGRDGA